MACWTNYFVECTNLIKTLRFQKKCCKCAYFYTKDKLKKEWNKMCSARVGCIKARFVQYSYFLCNIISAMLSQKCPCGRRPGGGLFSEFNLKTNVVAFDNFQLRKKRSVDVRCKRLSGACKGCAREIQFFCGFSQFVSLWDIIGLWQ